MVKKYIKSIYVPREWQKKAKAIMNRFTVLVMHRRAGKTVFDVNMMIEKIMKCKKGQPQGAYIAPTREQAKKIAWNSESGFKHYLRPFGDHVSYNEAELRIDLPNGGKIYLLGSENAEAPRGMYFDFVVLDEYQDMPSDYLDKVIAPTLMDRGGDCIITGTSKGKNRLYEAYQMALSVEHPDWSGFLMTADDTGEVPQEELDAAKRRCEDAYAQEFMCSFDAAIKGAYFGKQIERLIAEERVIDKEYDPASLVVAGLDIGFDGTSIWYLQNIAGQPVIIDLDYMEDKDIPYMANIMLGKPYIYSYIILPHDSVNRNIQDKRKTSIGQFKSIGFKVRLAEKLSLVNAVNAGRELLNRCQITKRCTTKKFKFGKGTSTALDTLSLYRADFDETEGIQKNTEKHDRASHIGSAFRTLAVGLKRTREDTDFKPVNIHIRRNRKPSTTRNNWSKFRR